MRRTATILLLLGAAAAADAREDRYREFFKTYVQGRWSGEEVADQRMLMVRNFKDHDVPAAAEWLLTDVVAKDGAANVVREAVRVLGSYERPQTVKHMVETWDRKLRRPDEIRAIALLAFGASSASGASEAVKIGLDDRDARVAAAACEAAGMRKDPDLKPTLVDHAVKHKNESVRVAAARALAAMRAESAMPELCLALAKEKSHRVRYELWKALRHLSRDDIGWGAKEWKEWYEKQRESVPEGAPNPWEKSYPSVRGDVAKHAPFFKIPIHSDRVCFVVDVSLSMEDAWAIDHAAERKKKPSERTPNFFAVKTRWLLVREHLKRCVRSLPDDTEIAVVFFSHEVHTWPDNARFVKASKKYRRSLVDHLEEGVKRSGGTAMYEGLAAGWGFLRDGHPEYNFKKGCDTLVFVTDGAPEHGEFKKQPDRIRDEVWRVARARNITVHTVGLHYHSYELLAGMAKDNHGLYVHVQQAGDETEPQDLDFWPEKKKAFEAARKKKR